MLVRVGAKEVWVNEPELSPIYARDPRTGQHFKLKAWKLLHVQGKPYRPYAVVSSDYEPVSHLEVINTARRLIKSFGFSIRAEDVVIEGRYGSRMFYKALLWEFEPTERDKVGLGVMVTNSYDTSLGLVTYFYALRLICLNEMVFGNEILKIRTLHVGDTVLERFEKNFEKVLDGVEDVQIFLKRLINAKVPFEVIDRFLERLKLAQKYRELVERQLGQKREEIPAWELYNAITYVLTHKAERMSYQRKTEYLRRLNAEMLALVRRVRT